MLANPYCIEKHQKCNRIIPTFGIDVFDRQFNRGEEGGYLCLWFEVKLAAQMLFLEIVSVI